jgi:hypothetical protein
VLERETAFAVETPPARETLAESRAMRGGGIAGAATIGAVDVESRVRGAADPFGRRFNRSG